MKTRYSHAAHVVALCVALVSTASAHHSQSEYDLRGKVEVQGAVTKVEWRSPHVWIYVDVTSDKGDTVNWSFELPSPVTLMRRGWTRDSLKPGDRVKVTGAPARNFPAIAIANSIRDSNDKPLFTGITKVNEPDTESKDPR
jgi:uncharacterized protein DUF6152